MAFGYAGWRAKRQAELESSSQVVETTSGLVEFSKIGDPPFVLVLHGGPGGHDQGFAATSLAKAGYGIITPSRPGYLRTPLSTGATFAEQADAFAALLDALEIDRVVPYGLSAGGPPAIQFAARHPERAYALLLACAVTQHYAPVIPKWASAVFLSGTGTRLQSQMFDLFPRQLIRVLLDPARSLPEADKKRLASAIASSHEQRAIARRLVSMLTPFDLRKAGLENDLVQLAAVDQLPFDRVECPALIAHGTADADVPFADAQRAAREIPRAELYTLERGWHLLNLSDGADAFEHRQIEFLRTHVGR